MFSGEIKPFIVMDVLEKAMKLERAGRSIVHLEIGEPDFPTPVSITEAAVEAMMNGQTHYTDSRGTPQLREAIASYYRRNYNVSVDAENVLVTMGTSPAMFMVLSVLIENPSDEVLLGNPCYPCYPNFVKMAGGIPRFVETDPAEGFQLTAARLKDAVTRNTKCIIINSPSNPTGTLIEPDELEKIASLGVPIISDEIYHGLVYGKRAYSMLEFTTDTFVLNGFSKLFAMTGWRLGYIIAPERYVRRLHILLQNLYISSNSFVQHAAVRALEGDIPEIEEMKKRYDARRRLLLEKLPELGIEIPVEPRGAFYFFINMKHIDNDSYRLAFDILEEVGVATTPGIDFGSRGEGYLRISYANSIENISEGLKRLGEFMYRRKKRRRL